MLDRMTHLFRLQAVIEEGSMRRAADRLGVTQPALTRSIAQLEESLGQPLLLRHARGVIPTEYGKRVVSSARRLSRHWEQIEAELADFGIGLRGQLRLTAGPLWRAVVLPTVIAELQGHFPGLGIEMQSGSFRNTATDLLEGRVDVVFGGVQMADGMLPRLVQREFTKVYDRVVAREWHPIFEDVSDGKLQDARRVLDFPWVVYTADPVYELETVHGTIERLGRSPDIRVRSESMIATLGILQKGDYLCVLPEAAVAGVIAPRLLPVPVEFGHRIIRSGAIFRQEMEDWPPLVRLLELSAAQFTTGED